MNKHVKRLITRLPLSAAVSIGAFLILYPLLWLLTSPFKSSGEFYSGTINLIPREMSLDIWRYIFIDLKDVFPVFRFAVNSVSITAGAAFLSVGSSVLGGYALARKAVPGKKIIIVLIMATMMLPMTSLVIPLYFVTNYLGLLDSFFGVVLVLSANPIPFLIIYRFFVEIDKSYEDSARVDGASDWTILGKILLPMSVSSISCASLMALIYAWSAFIEPFVITTTNKWLTLPVSLLYFDSSSFEAQNHERLAVAVLATLPVVVIFLLTQRKVFEGFTGGVKF